MMCNLDNVSASMSEEIDTDTACKHEQFYAGNVLQ